VKGFKSKHAFLILALILTFSASALPEVSHSEVRKVETGAVVIKSNSLEIDNSRKMVIFTGDVDARKDDLIINCQKMFLYYNDMPSDRDSGKVEIDIDKIVAAEHVTITRSDGGLATAEEAIYYQDGEKVVLTGKEVGLPFS
jgi:lipopolysaccharide export system protein LptA